MVPRGPTAVSSFARSNRPGCIQASSAQSRSFARSGISPKLIPTVYGWAPLKKDASARVEPVASKMPDLASNVVLKVRRMLILRCAHPSYHYGDDRLWDLPDFRGYTDHNIEEARR